MTVTWLGLYCNFNPYTETQSKSIFRVFWLWFLYQMRWFCSLIICSSFQTSVYASGIARHGVTWGWIQEVSPRAVIPNCFFSGSNIWNFGNFGTLNALFLKYFWTLFEKSYLEWLGCHPLKNFECWHPGPRPPPPATPSDATVQAYFVTERHKLRGAMNWFFWQNYRMSGMSF